MKNLISIFLVGTIILASSFFIAKYYTEEELSEFSFSLPTVFHDATQFLSSVFFVDSVTPDTLQDKYKQAKRGKEKVKILVVPGHDDVHSGASFGGIREADLTADLGQQLSVLLSQNENFEVVLSRTREGFNPVFEEYFVSHEQQIKDFMASQKKEMNSLVNQGKISRVSVVGHNNAVSPVVFRLYGFNLWANENGVDVAIHIHFNDHPRKNRNNPGSYSGFSIYVPEMQYSNSKGGIAVARSVFDELSKVMTVSNLPGEDGGLVPEQELIGIGANNTLDGAGMLIEYGYIYEPQFRILETRTKALAELARATAEGVVRFFTNGDSKLTKR